MPPLRLIGRIISVLVLVLAVILIRGWSTWTGDGPGPETEQVSVTIPQGATTDRIAEILHEHTLLTDERIFELGVRVSGLDGRLRAGRFLIPANTSPRDIAHVLATGALETVAVTLIEGESAAIALARLGEALQCDLEALHSAYRAVIQEILERPGWLSGDPGDYHQALAEAESVRGRPAMFGEGYLLPNTYRFVEGVEPELVVRTLVQATLDTLNGLLSQEGRDSRSNELGPHDLLTLASIVEAETPMVAEMPRVAAVYLNRLAAGHHLEADPTVAYAVDKQGKRLFYRDLKADSPFNTYRRPGLPPGPIACPGRAAIAAVVFPDPDREVFYFVADGRGGHVFSKTYAEHEQAVAGYRRTKTSGQVGDS